MVLCRRAVIFTVTVGERSIVCLLEAQESTRQGVATLRILGNYSIGQSPVVPGI